MVVVVVVVVVVVAVAAVAAVVVLAAARVWARGFPPASLKTRRTRATKRRGIGRGGGAVQAGREVVG